MGGIWGGKKLVDLRGPGADPDGQGERWGGSTQMVGFFPLHIEASVEAPRNQHCTQNGRFSTCEWLGRFLQVSAF